MRKSQLAPRLLGPGDLAALRALAGDAAIEYVAVLGGFHFINRIADLLHVDREVLPDGLRRFELLRRLSVRAMGWMFRWMDLRNRPYGASFRETVERFAAAWPERDAERLARDLAPVAARPPMVEALALGREELRGGSLDGATLRRVFGGVEEALPGTEEEATGFHDRPADPLDAFVFVGTRYAQRATEEMLGRLRRVGYDDRGLLDLAIAVAEANAWARMRRLLDLDPSLLEPPGPERECASVPPRAGVRL